MLCHMCQSAHEVHASHDRNGILELHPSARMVHVAAPPESSSNAEMGIAFVRMSCNAHASDTAGVLRCMHMGPLWQTYDEIMAASQNLVTCGM